MEVMSPACAGMVAVCLPVPASQSRISPAPYFSFSESQTPLTEARTSPFGLKATNATESAWPWRVVCSLPVSMSQSLTVLSQLAEASVLPLGLNATHTTASPRDMPFPPHFSTSFPADSPPLSSGSGFFQMHPADRSVTGCARFFCDR